MATKKRRKLKKKPIIISFFLIFIIILIPKTISKFSKMENIDNNIDNDNEISEIEEKIKYVALITDNSEQNYEKVKEYFANGMSSEEYRKTIEKQDNYVTKKGKYEEIKYAFDKNLSYEELEEIYNKLALSSIVRLEIIGTSVDGRNLYSVEIGNGDNVTMFEAGIHAAEVASPLFITKFMVDIVNSYENDDPDIINLLKNNKIVILPSANPDGYDAAIFGVSILNNNDLYLAQNGNNDNLKYLKCNANGVDLNRNFPSQTAGLYYNNYKLHYTVSLKKSANKFSYFPGENLGSEPETRAIMYWQNKWVNKLKSYVALHSAGRVVYNGKPYLSDEYNDNSHKCANIVGKITGYEVLSKADEEAGEGNDGTSSEYMAETLSGFIFSTKTGRLSSDYYAKKYDDMKYKNTCVVVIEALENYTTNLEIIKNEYYNYKLEKTYTSIIERD